MHFLAGEHFAAVHFPSVQNFAAQRQDGLKFLVPRLFGRASGGITLDQKQLGARRILPGTIGQLARQGRPLGNTFAFDLFTGLEATACVVDRQVSQLQAQFGVRVEPQAEGIFDHTRNERGGFAGRQALFGLAGKLRFLHLHRQHESDALPDVFRRELDATRQQIAELIASSKPWRKPLTWVPPCAVGIRLT